MKSLFAILLISSVSYASQDPTALLDRAVRTNNISLAEKAIDQGADVNLLHAYGKANLNPLVSIAIKKSNYEIVELMINSKDFNPNLSTPTTTVVNTAIKKHAPLSIIKRLFELGANKHSLNGLARSPFQVAAAYDYTQATEYMLSDYEFNITEGGAFCALRLAVKFNHTETIELIEQSDRYNELTNKCLAGVVSQRGYLNTH